MAQLASIAGQGMIQTLTQAGPGAIMTTRLGTRLTNNRGMVKYGLQKAGCAVMAHVAFGRCRRVGSMFTQSDYAIVASATHISDLVVGKRNNHRTPCTSGMASFAGIGSQWMRGCFIRAAMTTHRGTSGDNGFSMWEWQQ